MFGCKKIWSKIRKYKEKKKIKINKALLIQIFFFIYKKIKLSLQTCLDNVFLFSFFRKLSLKKKKKKERKSENTNIIFSKFAKIFLKKRSENDF